MLLDRGIFKKESGRLTHQLKTWRFDAARK